MLAIKPPGYFADTKLQGRLCRFLRYAFSGDLTLASAPIIVLASGAEPGEVRLTVEDLLSTGDEVYVGDGAGVLAGYQWTYPGGPVADTEPNAVLVFPEELYGSTVAISVWAVTAAGAGAATVQSILIPGNPLDPEEPLFPDIWPTDGTIWPADATIWPTEP